MNPWIEVFGRLHPMLLHLPIGLIAALAALEVWAIVRRKAMPREFVALLVWLTAAFSVFSAVTGFVLSYEGNFSGPTLDNHLILGILVAIASLFTAWLHRRPRPAAYRIGLVVTAALLVPTGHLGASLTHGEDFLTAPLAPKGAPTASPTSTLPHIENAAATPAVVPTFAAVEAILANRCIACHGSPRGKGGLRLDSVAAIQKGGKSGPTLIAGDPAASELIQRMKLPLEADGHMPPASKPQPSEAEIRTLEAWIAAGASFDATDAPASAASSDTAATAPAETAAELKPASPAAIVTLRSKLVHVEPVAAGSPLLWVDFAAVATQTGDAEVREWLSPLRDNIERLALARSRITDESAALLAEMPNLRRLDLRATAIGNATLATLRGHTRLQELVLSQCKLDDASVESLAAFESLRRVHVWNAGLSAEAIAKLRKARPELQVVAGDEADAAAAEREGELKFTSDAPLPGQPTTPTSLAPVNTKCAVTGSPVNPAFLVVYKGRVIGFCCENCPKEFWTSPEKFQAALP